MAIEAELAELYINQVEVYPFLKSDKYGTDSYGPPVVLPCRLEGRTREIITPTGSKQASTGQAYLTDVYPWMTEKCDLKVLNPAGVWEWVELLNVDTHYDQDTPYYQVLYYGVRTKG